MLAAVSAVPSAVPLFGCFFVGHSYPILSNQGFQQVGNWGEGRGASVPGGFDAWGIWCLGGFSVLGERLLCWESLM